jgi:dephospho-CoA kinase
MMIVALTGGIGSGKTTIAKLFETMGCVVYNSDERAKELYNNPEVKKQVIALLGVNAYSEDHKLNKEFISDIIFNEKDKLEKLNAIIHPTLALDFQNFVKQQNSESIIIKESALIFETELYKKFTTIILVIAPLEQKIKRVMSRNLISKEEVDKRMQAQWTDEQKLPLANYVISNNETDALIPQVLSVIQKLKSNA